MFRIPLSVSATRCHLSRGERQERSNAGVVWIRRGDVGIAPYMNIPSKRTDVGDGLRTSCALNNGIIFTRAVKVRRTSTSCPPFPGEGGKGDGALRGRIALSVNA